MNLQILHEETGSMKFQNSGDFGNKRIQQHGYKIGFDIPLSLAAPSHTINFQVQMAGILTPTKLQA